MKITNVDVHLASEWRTFLFVVVSTDEGVSGVGEAGLTGRELAVRGALEHFAPQIVGEDPFRIEHIWQSLSRGGFYPAGVVMSAAIAAIDMALWDIKAKALGAPLYELFGGRVRDKVLTYNHLHGRDTAALVEAARASVEAGWKCLRFEPSYREADETITPRVAVREGIAHWQAIREAVGDDIELCYDVHTRLGNADALRLCREVEPFRPFFIEDALRSEHVDGYRRLRDQTAVPLAAGEQFANKWDFKPLIEQQLIDFARIDLCICGGLTEGRKIAGWCETNGIDIAVHNPIGPVSTAACLHFNIACSNFGVMELPKRPGETMAEAFQSDFQWKDGYLLPPEAPGLGVTFDPEGLKAYPFKATELPKLKREDGAFWNW